MRDVTVINPLIGMLKPHSNGRLYSNTMIGTLAVDGLAVTFGTTNVTAHPLTASVPTAYYSIITTSAL